MPLKPGQYINGIRSLDDLRDRCRVDEITGCWNWALAFSNGDPCVVVTINGRKQRGYRGMRAAIMLRDGPLPTSVQAWRLIGCSSDACVNPAHGMKGTIQQRVDYFVKHGKTKHPTRWLKSSQLATARVAKITRDQAREIRDSAENGRVLAKQYGISQSQVSNIKRGACWADPVAVNASVFAWRPAG